MKTIPNHIAISIDGVLRWSEEHSRKLDESYRISFNVLYDFMKTQVKLNIPIATVLVMPEHIKDTEEFSPLAESFMDFLTRLKLEQYLTKNSIKVSFLGKWYDLPGRMVESIRDIITLTKDNDTFFLNICINYNGHEEIVDACKMIARKITAGKLDIESINKERIKENLYSSYFLPPDLIIKTGLKPSLGTFMLWDSAYSEIIFTRKLWPDLNEADFKRLVS